METYRVYVEMPFLTRIHGTYSTWAEAVAECEKLVGAPKWLVAYVKTIPADA